LSDAKRFDLGDVRVPCPVGWSSMRGTNVTRTCATCDRQVHDLSAMTSAEAETLLAGDGRVCVRLCRGADGRIITADRRAAFGIEKGPFAGASSIAALAAFIGIAHPAVVTAAAEQAQSAQESPTASRIQPIGRRPAGTIAGVVRAYYNGDGLSDATVLVISEDTAEQYTTRSDYYGAFRLTVPAGLYTVSVTGDGLTIPGGAGSVLVKARRTSTVVVDLSFVVTGEYIRSYPDTPPPPLSRLDPRDTSQRPPPDSSLHEPEQWRLTAWVSLKMEQLKAWLSGR
jgi:hypothetical protein